MSTTPDFGTLTIRAAQVSDAAPIAGLIGELGYRTSATDMAERLGAIVPNPDYHTLVATDAAHVVGMAGMAVGRYYEKNGIYVRLLALVVHEESRRRGIGTVLVRAAEAWARTRGATAVIINSGNHRSQAHEFFRWCGYAATGVRLVKSMEAAV